MVFLGHVDSKEGIMVDMLKVKVIIKQSRPTSVTKLEVFGLSLLLLKFCEGFFKDNISPNQFVQESY